MFGLVPFKKDFPVNDDAFGALFRAFDEPFFRSMSEGMGLPGYKGGFKVDVRETEQDYELTAELPGLTKDDISLDYTDGYLTISANKSQVKNEGDEKSGYIRRERSFGQMSRSFYIDNIDKTKTTAGFKDGILTVRLPKLTENQMTRHEIKITD